MPVFIRILVALLASGCASSEIRLNLSSGQVTSMIQAQKTTLAARRFPPTIRIIITTKQEKDLAILSAVTGHPEFLAADIRQKRSVAKRLPNLLALDPAEMVQKRFLTSLERALPPVNFTYYPDPFDKENMKTMRATFGDRIISLYETHEWKIFKSATLLDIYRISYTGRAVFYRASDNAILWEGTCTCESPDDDQGPTLRAITVNNGAILRQYLVKLGESCADILSRDFLAPK